MKIWPLLTLLCCAADPAFAATSNAKDCAVLATLKLPMAKIESAASVAKGEPLVLWQGGQAQPSPVAFCRVRGVSTPVKGSRIGFEVWLPPAQAWNGKFMQAGNGGTAGGVPLVYLLDGVQRGYAAAATDGGHVWPDGMDYGWAKGHPERVVDFGWRAVQQTTRVGKRIVAAGYGEAPRRSYFVGCSDGGRDAMVAAQRFATEWDGIVAGAPAQDWLGLMIVGALLQRELAPPANGLPVGKLPAIQAAALASCAGGKPYVQDPQQCKFDPQVLLCAGAQTDACLTEPQVRSVRAVYAGVTDEGGNQLPGLSMGAEAEPGNWDFWLLRSPTNTLDGHKARPGDPPPTSINERFFRYLVRNDESFVLSDLTGDDVLQARKRYGATLNATNPDLHALKSKGGKLIQYHGWTDSAIPPGISINYFNTVQQSMGDTSDFYRLFMVPGMNHCGGGAGPSSVDWLNILERWVEMGEAPQGLTAKDMKSGSTQLLLPYSHNR